MRFLVSTVALCLIGLASAQNIYDGCGVDKECLGYEPDNPAENACLEAQTCHLVVSYRASEDGLAFFELLHSDETAADGWVAVGFSEDAAMGDEAVVMATATGITSRWNNGSPNRGSVETEDFGVVGAIVQASEGMLYAAFEMPSIFAVVNPNDGSLLTEDLACDHVYLIAGGDLDTAGEPIKHDFRATSENLISVCPSCPCTEE